MVVGDRWKREMHHLVREHPVGCEACHGGLAADMNPDEAAAVLAERLATAYAATTGRDDAEQNAGYGVAAIVSRDRLGSPVHPLQERLVRYVERALLNLNVDS
jgi:hypothetical protein